MRLNRESHAKLYHYVEPVEKKCHLRDNQNT